MQASTVRGRSPRAQSSDHHAADRFYRQQHNRGDCRLGDGATVYGTNRRHDSVAIYRAAATTGLLTPAGWQPTGGVGPRFLGLDPTGRFLYAANEDGDTIVTFALDASGGLGPIRSAHRDRQAVTIVFSTNP